MAQFREVHPPQLVSYYPFFQGFNSYGIYSPGMDRFLAVSGLDLSAVLSAAKLLSAKIATQVYVFAPGSPALSNDDCLNWTLRDKSVHLSDLQTPIVNLLASPKDLVRADTEVNSQENPEFVKTQDYVLFLLRAVHALRLTDAKLNTVDQGYYSRFLSGFPEADRFRVYIDDTKWPRGFVTTIETVLYKSQSVEEALQGFSLLFPYGRSMHVDLKVYAALFYELLGWRPADA
jgi:hypothetical protein